MEVVVTRELEEVVMGWMVLFKYWLSRVGKIGGTRTRGGGELSLAAVESTLETQKIVDSIILFGREGGVYTRMNKEVRTNSIREMY